MKLSSLKVKKFQDTIWAYYKQNKRDFPWRETTDPYKILVSEVMLQQTQTARVVPKYELFLEKFPRIKDLAKAANEDVLRLWSGLGYNRRALYLKRSAETIVREKRESTLDPEFLVSLPGIGPNTAGAVYVFSTNKPYVFIETNIRRVFIHEFFDLRFLIMDKEILELIETTLDKESPREWYYALMDYGAHLGKSEVNPNRKSKHYTKQSQFKGSIREARGKILKILLEGKQISITDLEQKINSPHFTDALNQLEKEKILKIEKNIIDFF